MVEEAKPIVAIEINEINEGIGIEGETEIETRTEIVAEMAAGRIVE